MDQAVAVRLNVLALYGVAAVLALAFAFQVARGELPCPLCLLQRIQFAALAIGPMLNLRFGCRPSHYAVSLIAAVLGAAVAMRQVLLHILPGDPGFGTAILGYHYYTWAFLLFAAAIVRIALMLLFDRQFDAPREAPAVGAFATAAAYLVIGLTAANALTTLLECGFGACPDNPVAYELLRPRS